mgnify:CR=1 FL=1
MGEKILVTFISEKNASQKIKKKNKNLAKYGFNCQIALLPK